MKSTIKGTAFLKTLYFRRNEFFRPLQLQRAYFIKYVYGKYIDM